MTGVIAKERVTRALRMKVPAEALTDIPIVSQVLLFREKPENKWVGPYTTVGENDKSVFIHLNGTNHQVSIDKVKVHNTSASVVPIFSTSKPRITAASGPGELHMEPRAAPQSDVLDI